MDAPLHGVKVVDLSWVMVGPLSARGLADLGAEVVKVESSTRIDPVRAMPPFKDGAFGVERSLSYHNYNADKRCVCLNLKHPGGREAVVRLARWADVLIESFAPRVLTGLGLTYAQLREENERLIMVSTSIAGQTGPHSGSTKGLGTTGAALAGATFLVGWPDRAPVPPFGPWTDEVTPRFIVSAVLAALHRRRRTGEGAYIDVAQTETGLQFLLPAVLELAVNGNVPQRRGSGSAHRVPFGIYPCLGEDRWVALDGSRPAAWSALRGLVGPALAEARFDTLLGRLRGREEIDAAIGAWTRAREAQEVETSLQAHGVPAHVVSRAGDLAGDPHLADAGHLRWIDDPVVGRAAVEGPRFRLSRSPLPETTRGPRIGEHTDEVLRTLCGYVDAEITRLRDEGALA
jgi:benzylsuccinate CoA-transferase BbsF subunit